MALSNRLPTEADLKAIMDTSWSMPSLSWMLCPEPAHSCVNYSARKNRSTYTPPELFYWHVEPSPSDCVWMVPGTARQRS